MLNNVSARANHSEVLAIAGPSGSSKTTFLDALAGQIQRKSLKGQILVNGRTMDSNFRRVSAYVTQVCVRQEDNSKVARSYSRSAFCHVRDMGMFAC